MEYSREDLPTATISLAVFITILYGIQKIVHVLFGEYPGFTQLQHQTPGATVALYIQDLSPVGLLIISPFLHGHFIHLLGNLAGVLFFGSAMEKVSRTLYLLCFLASSYLSSILTYWAKVQENNPFPHTMGISAGIYAVAAFVGIHLLGKIWRPLLKQEIDRILIVKLVIVCLGISLTFVSFRELIFGGAAQTNQFGHALGSIFGIVLFVVKYIDDRLS